MPRATLHDDHGRRRVFLVNFCPVHVLYNGALYARQRGGSWDRDSDYRAIGVLILDDAMREDHASSFTSPSKSEISTQGD
jgi:hypothetical protein